MKLKSLLLERLVDSSWLKDITYHSRHNRLFPGEAFITFKTKTSPKTYIVRGISKKTFNDWMRFPSKGKFWHKIKNEIDRSWFDSKPFRIISWKKVQPKKRIS